LVDCDYPSDFLIKAISNNLLTTYADASTFLQKFSLENEDQINVMADIFYNSNTLFNASCVFLKKNLNKIEKWVPVSNSSTNYFLFLFIIPIIFFLILLIPISVILVILIIFLIYQKRQRKKKLKNAPKENPVTILFTDIQSSTSLWENDENLMKKTIEVHNEILRMSLKKFFGYECKTQVNLLF